jgi:hypothetical protein
LGENLRGFAGFRKGEGAEGVGIFRGFFRCEPLLDAREVQVEGFIGSSWREASEKVIPRSEPALVAVEADTVFPCVEALFLVIVEGSFERERFDDGFRWKRGQETLERIEGATFEGRAGKGQGGGTGEHFGTEDEICAGELASPFDGFSPDAGGGCCKGKGGLEGLASVDSDAEVRKASWLAVLERISERLQALAGEDSGTECLSRVVA